VLKKNAARQRNSAVSSLRQSFAKQMSNGRPKKIAVRQRNSAVSNSKMNCEKLKNFEKQKLPLGKKRKKNGLQKNSGLQKNTGWQRSAEKLKRHDALKKSAVGRKNKGSQKNAVYKRQKNNGGDTFK
jgi:hypothetical protein